MKGAGVSSMKERVSVKVTGSGLVARPLSFACSHCESANTYVQIA
jgi:hypothetical protein